jgi:DhnA family fructose-bisphosphate aldolase class Ia
MLSIKTHRLNKIFREDGRVVIFAMDHAGAFGLMPGLEKPGEVVAKVRAGGADAILTTYGICRNFADQIGDMSIVMRLDGGTSKLSPVPGAGQAVYKVPDALRLGAEAVCVMGMPGSQFECDTLPYLSEIVCQGEEWGIPVMAEMLPGGFEDPGKWWTAENIGHACRIGAELGVDFIKTTYSGDPKSFRNIVDQIYVPIVVLGGSKSKDPADLLTGIYESIQAGAVGVAVGRNIYQHEHPDKITAAIAAIVHEDATVEKALEHMK